MKLKIKDIILTGTISGVVMGLFLFLGGAILARIIYGPQFTPPGKFEPEQINAFYFFWTKIVIGWFFGLLFTIVYEMLPLNKRFTGVVHGLKYGFIFWLILALWAVSHPLIYGPIKFDDQIFWPFYQLFGFLGLGGSLGFMYGRKIQK